MGLTEIMDDEETRGRTPLGDPTMVTVRISDVWERHGGRFDVADSRAIENGAPENARGYVFIEKILDEKHLEEFGFVDSYELKVQYYQ